MLGISLIVLSCSAWVLLAEITIEGNVVASEGSFVMALAILLVVIPDSARPVLEVCLSELIATVEVERKLDRDARGVSSTVLVTGLKTEVDSALVILSVVIIDSVRPVLNECMSELIATVEVGRRLDRDATGVSSTVFVTGLKAEVDSATETVETSFDDSVRDGSSVSRLVKISKSLVATTLVGLGVALKDISKMLETEVEEAVTKDEIGIGSPKEEAESAGLEIGALITSEDEVISELGCRSIDFVVVILGGKVSTGVLTTSLLVTDTTIEYVGTGRLEVPSSIEVKKVMLPPVKVGVVTDCACEVPLAAVEAEVGSEENFVVEEWIRSDTVGPADVDSSFELIVVSSTLASASELVVDSLSRTVEETMFPKLVIWERLDNTIVEIWGD